MDIFEGILFEILSKFQKKFDLTVVKYTKSNNFLRCGELILLVACIKKITGM